MSRQFKTLLSKRARINKIDEKIVLLLNQRIVVINDIKKIKKTIGLDIRDKRRTKELLNKTRMLLKKKKHKTVVLSIYKKILSQSLNFLLNE